MQLCVVLAVTAVLLVVLAAAHLEDADLVVPAVSQNNRLDIRTRDPGSPDLQISAATHGENLFDHDFLAHVRSYLFYLDLFADGNLVLFASGFYDRVHV